MSASGVEMAAPRRSPAITAASILYLVFGLGTAASEIPAIAYMVQNRTFPVVFGIPLMGSWFSERLGIDFTIRAAIVFTVVSALEALAGYWLWKSDRRGGRLGRRARRARAVRSFPDSRSFARAGAAAQRNPRAAGRALEAGGRLVQFAGLVPMFMPSDCR